MKFVNPLTKKNNIYFLNHLALNVKKVFGNVKIYFRQETCTADAGIFLRSRGRGVQEQLKKSFDNFYFSPQLFYRGALWFNLKENLYFPRCKGMFPKMTGGPTFSRGSTIFPEGGGGGANAYSYTNL